MFFKVKQDQCIACGLCQLCAPQLISYNDEGLASITPDHNKGQQNYHQEDESLLKTAARQCPVAAILHQGQAFPVTDGPLETS